jgi:hypothetical protein
VDTRDAFFQRDPFAALDDMKSAMDDSLEHTHLQNPEHPGHLVKHNFLLFPAERFFLGESDFLQNGPYMWNRKWIVQTFGLPFYHALSRASIRGDGGDVMFPILCGGLYAGSVEAMIDFFDLFVESTLVLGGCGTNDQGLLNGLVAVGLFASRFPHPVFISDPYTSLFTNGPRGGGEITWDQHGRIVSCSGALYSVLHQYDRYKTVWQPLLLSSASG